MPYLFNEWFNLETNQVTLKYKNLMTHNAEYMYYAEGTTKSLENVSKCQLIIHELTIVV